MRTTIATDEAPKPVGPYSQAVVAGDLIFLAGQIPMNPETGQLERGDVTAQTRRVFENVRAILHAAGSSLAKVVKVNVYLADMKDFPAMNQVYAMMFEPPYPARATIQAAALPGGAAVEIECVAQR